MKPLYDNSRRSRLTEPRFAFLAFGLVIAVMIGLGIAVGTGNESERPRPVGQRNQNCTGRNIRLLHNLRSHLWQESGRLERPERFLQAGWL